MLLARKAQRLDDDGETIDVSVFLSSTMFYLSSSLYPSLSFKEILSARPMGRMG